MMISYLDNAQVVELLNHAPQYQKSAKTGLRLIRSSEINTKLITYVKNGDTVRQESESVLSSDKILARNANVIGVSETGQNIYNEWPLSRETAIKNYGQDVIDSLTDVDFTYHKKQATLKAIPLTQEVLNILGVKGDKLEIKVSWSDEPMVAHMGDYLADGGYSVSSHDMKDYELIK